MEPGVIVVPEIEPPVASNTTYPPFVVIFAPTALTIVAQAPEVQPVRLFVA